MKIFKDTFFHPTDLATANLINKNGFTGSMKTFVFLGHGIYFMDKLTYARQWSYLACLQAIIKADVAVADRQVLDLDDDVVHRDFIETMRLVNQTSTFNFNSKLQCIGFMVEYFSNLNNCTVIVYTITDRDLFYLDLSLEEFETLNNRVQLCVIDVSCIQVLGIIKQFYFEEVI